MTPVLLVTYHQPAKEAAFSKLFKSPAWNDMPREDADLTVLSADDKELAIKNLRKVMADSSYPPYNRTERAILMIGLEKASLPAQQALLKLFEEPPEYLRIIATTSQLHDILPTIQSRSEIKHLNQANNTPEVNSEAREIIENLETLSISDAISLAETYKDREAAEQFLRDCVLACQQSEEYPSRSLVFSAETMLEHITYLQKNANVRLTIEHCFLTIFRQKK